MVFKKAQLGSDVSQPATGYSDKSSDNDGKGSSLFSVRDCLNKVIRELEGNYGYLVKPEIGGLFCGHSVYKREHKISIKGIVADERFWYWRQINPSTESTGFLSAIKETAEDLMSHCESGEIQIYKNIALCFMDNPTDTKSIVFRAASGTHLFSVREDSSKKVTLAGTSGNFRVVPMLSWFPEALQEFDARKLLTLLPDAEARQLMLILGRTVVGANSTLSAEGEILHTARSYAILVGTQAGLGKSTLIGYINNALTTLGFQVSNAPINDTKFGWGTIAQSDLAFIDDLTDEVQKRLLSDVRVKSIVSNNTLKVEEKGQPSVDVRATTVLLGCTNKHNPAHYIGMDSGSISRVNQLDTYNEAELKRIYKDIKDARIKPYWELLAKQFKVTPECLAAYLLRRSADYFLETCGYTWDDRRLFKDAEDHLEEVTKANRKQFRIDTSLRHAEELVTAIGHLVALAIADVAEHKRESYLELLDYLDFSSSLLLAIMRLHSLTRMSSKLPEGFNDLSLHNASWDCKEFISKKLNELDKLATSRSSENAFNILISELKSNKGFGYPSKSCHYMPDWEATKRMIPEWVNNYHESIKGQVPKNIQIAIAEVQKIFTDLQ